MPFRSRRARLQLSEEERQWLQRVSQSRSEPAGRVQRAQVLLRYHGGDTVSAIAAQLRTNRPKVERLLAKALGLGVRAALADLPGRGRRPRLTPDARAWVVALACQKPPTLGYAQELWTTRLLAKHVRAHCAAAGHPSLLRLGRGTVSKLLRAQTLQPHKVRYYLERRDPEFEPKMQQVLHVYNTVELWRRTGAPAELVAVLSYDEKPGIQVLQSTALDRPPVPGLHPTWDRDHEYVRHGTLSLLAGIDLLTGEVLGLVRERHRSREFIEFLQVAHARYPATARIRIVLDNHSAHISRETQAYLATLPNRFEFIFTPKHGSWLNLVEAFFSKMARTLFRGIRAASKDEMKARIELYLQEVNAEPVVFRWKYKLDTVAVA
jgi:transposase